MWTIITITSLIAVVAILVLRALTFGRRTDLPDDPERQSEAPAADGPPPPFASPTTGPSSPLFEERARSADADAADDGNDASRPIVDGDTPGSDS